MCRHSLQCLLQFPLPPLVLRRSLVAHPAFQSRQPVLVTGATGATGGYTIRALTELDVSIRAMVRKDDDRAARFRTAGVEVVLGDLLDLDSVRAAMEGVSAAYFVYPLLRGL